MKARFLAAARKELREAVFYYNSERPRLGDEFRDEVKAGLQRILDHPTAWQPLGERTRRLRLHRFPYGIVYQVRADHVLVVAVMHLHREPDYWRHRVEPA